MILKRIFFALFLLLQSFVLLAQDKTVEIIQSNGFEFLRTPEGDMKKLVGNVILKQGDIMMWCDSAYFKDWANTVDAYGNVKVKQGDSITLYCKVMHYFGNEKKLIAHLIPFIMI